MLAGLAIATSGLVAGALHVLSGPDHLAAIAPLAADTRRKPWRSGLLWALGHTAGVLVIGVIVLVLRESLPLESIASVSERVVGVALIGVGAWGFRRAMRSRVHVHAHAHGAGEHVHVHVHDTAHRHAPADAPQAHDHVHASFLFGILHGIAGSSHFFGILPALALPTRGASVTYLLAYGVGTVLAMTSFSTLVGVAAASTRVRGGVVYSRLLYACSTAAVVVGSAWLLV